MIVLIKFLSLTQLAPAASAQTLAPASGHSFINQAGGGGSFAPAFSADGGQVVFLSYANNLVTNDDLSPNLDVFVASLSNGVLTLASVNTNGVGGGDADAVCPSISSNGQFVAFASLAGNLVLNDSNRASDVFLRDLAAGATELISVGLDGASPPNVHRFPTNSLSTHPRVSADGRWVFFESAASNLVALADENLVTDVFARDRQAGITLLLSVNTNGMAAANGPSELADITPDGHYAVFTSTATDLAPGVTNRGVEVYVRDLLAETTVWASDSTPSFAVTGDYYACKSPVITPDGRFVAYQVSDRVVIRRDLWSTEVTNHWRVRNEPVGPAPLAISDHGRYVALEAYYRPQLYNFISNVARIDFEELEVCGTNLVGAGSADPQYVTNYCWRLDFAYPSNFVYPSYDINYAFSPALSADGQRVLFVGTTNDSNVPDLIEFSFLGLRDFRQAEPISLGLLDASKLHLGAPAISRDGLHAAFDAEESSLVPSDRNQASDVFVHDIGQSATRLISQRHPDLADVTGSGMTILGPNSLSADGRIIAFLSADSSLTHDDTNGLVDVIVRDLAAGTAYAPGGIHEDEAYSYTAATNPVTSAIMSADGSTVLYARYGSGHFPLYRFGWYWFLCTSNGCQVMDRAVCPPATSYRLGQTWNAAMNADGRLVAFDTTVPADDLLCGGITDVNGTNDIVLRDFALPTNFNRILSRNLGGSATGNSDSVRPQISPDNQWVLFQSRATDLVTNAVPAGIYQFYARHLGLDQTFLISSTPDGGGLPEHASNAVFSADARWVVFQSGTQIYRHSLGTVLPNELLLTNGLNPAVSADGRWVAYEQDRHPASGLRDLSVLDLQSGATELISLNRAGTGPANGSSTTPLICPDGRLVVFASHASDLVPEDTNGASDVFVRFRASGITLAISHSARSGGMGNGISSHPVLSADGRTVAFQSFASDLVAGDYNDQRDVFIARLAAPDSDGDGLDDDWELAYFDNLDRDGTGDADADGASDDAEFRAGTDPTNRGSVLRVLTVMQPGGGATTVLWSAAPGRTYQVQFKDTVDAEWADLPGPVTAGSGTGAVVDATAGDATARFYRVVLLP